MINKNELERVRYIVEQLTKGGSRSVRLTNKFNITKKDLPALKSIIAEGDIGGDISINDSLKSIASDMFASGEETTQADNLIIEKILTNRPGLEQYKNTVLGNVADTRIDEDAKIKSEQLFKQSEGVASETNEIYALKKAVRNFGWDNIPDNELRLTSTYKKQYEKLAKSTTVNLTRIDEQALKHTRNYLNRQTRLNDVRPTGFQTTVQGLKNQIKNKETAISELKYKEGFAHPSEYYPNAHIDAYTNYEQKLAGLPEGFKSVEELDEYTKMATQFDKYKPSIGEKALKSADKRIEQALDIAQAESKVGITDTVNVMMSTSEQRPGSYHGNPFSPIWDQDMTQEKHIQFQTAKANYEKFHGTDTIPSNYANPTAPNKIIGEDFKIGQKVTFGYDKEGKAITRKVGPPLTTPPSAIQGRISDTEYLWDPEFTKIVVDDKGQYRTAAIKKQDPKPTNVPSNKGVPRVKTDLSNYSYSVDRAKQFKNMSDNELKLQIEYSEQLGRLSKMFDKVENPENIDRLALRNLRKGVEISPNMSLLKKVIKALP
jgi:hypothetical protein